MVTVRQVEDLMREVSELKESLARTNGKIEQLSGGESLDKLKKRLQGITIKAKEAREKFERMLEEYRREDVRRTSEAE